MKELTTQNSAQSTGFEQINKNFINREKMDKYYLATLGAYCWMKANRVFSDNFKVTIGKTQVLLEKDEISYSMNFLAKRWSLSRSYVEKILKNMQTLGMIKITGTVDTQEGYKQYVYKVIVTGEKDMSCRNTDMSSSNNSMSCQEKGMSCRDNSMSCSNTDMSCRSQNNNIKNYITSDIINKNKKENEKLDPTSLPLSAKPVEKSKESKLREKCYKKLYAFIKTKARGNYDIDYYIENDLDTREGIVKTFFVENNDFTYDDIKLCYDNLLQANKI